MQQCGQASKGRDSVGVESDSGESGSLESRETFGLSVSELGTREISTVHVLFWFFSFNVMLLSQISGDYYKVKIISVVLFEFVNGSL